MESKRQTSVSELRSVFAKSQLTGSSKSSEESLDTTNQVDRNDSESPVGFSGPTFERNISSTRSLPKPTISPKPTSLNSSSRPGIKNLVAALEGSHGMYTTRNIPKKHGITLKDLRESSETHKSLENNDQVTSKLLKKETNILQPAKSISDDLNLPAINQNNLDSNGNKVAQTLVADNDNKKVPGTFATDMYRCDQENNVFSVSVVNGINYTRKSKSDYFLRYVPSKEELGPAPAKPVKPAGMRLPLRETSNYSSSSHSSSDASLPPQLPERNPNMSPKPPARLPPKPPRSLPKAPESPPILPELDTTLHVSEEPEEEEEEIYNDVIFHSGPSSPSCPGEDGFISPDEDIYDDHSPHYVPPSLPRHPPPLPPVNDNESTLLTTLTTDSIESSENDDTDAIYEEAAFGPDYENTEEAKKKPTKKKKRALKTEQKTLEKIEKKREKFMKKFSLSGEEIPLDAGTVKNDSRGNKFDLNVVKGETVLILRMENNPSGKWLVKNGKGRVGYVELTNIKVDVESVKSVMVARTSQILMDDQDNYSSIK